MVAGDHARALGEYKKMTAIDPNDGQALAGIGVALLNLRRFVEAASALERAEPFANQDSLLYEELAVTYVALGQDARAEAVVRRHTGEAGAAAALARVRARARRLTQR